MRKNIIDLKTAIDLIRNAVADEKKHSEEGFPYFFLIGAGVSAPEIKDASRMAADCAVLAEKQYLGDFVRYKQLLTQAEKYADDPGRLYSFWLRAAFQNKKERRQYLKTLVEPAKISTANLLLGQLLCSKRLAASVLSANFDDKLAQALSLLGARGVFIADDPCDCSDISPSDGQLQLIYVNGTYPFYDCGKDGAQLPAPADDIQNMANVLDSFYKTKTPIVVGYGGCENDLIMARLKDALRHPLPYSVLWFCYDQKAYDALPEWLKNNGNVLFVLPERAPDCSSAADCFLSTGAEIESVLPAADVLRAMIARFEIEPPEIFYDPYAYYTRAFAQSLGDDSDELYLRAWLKRMRRRSGGEASDTDILLQKLEHAAVRKNLPDVAVLARELGAASLTKEACSRVLFDILYPLLSNKNGIASDEDRLALCAEALSYLEKLLYLVTQAEGSDKVLSAVMSVLPVKNEACRARVLSLCDRIILLCRQDAQQFGLEIQAMCIKAELLTGAQRYALQEQIAGRCFFHKDKPEAALSAITALYRMFIRTPSPDEQRLLLDHIEELSFLFPDNEEIQMRFFEARLRALELSGGNPSRFSAYISEMAGRGDPEYHALILKAYQTQIRESSDPAEQLRLCKAALKYGGQPDAAGCGSVLAFIDILSTMVYIFTGRQELSHAKEYCHKILELQKRIPLCVYARRHGVFAMNLLAYTAADDAEKEKWYRAIISLCMPRTDIPELLSGLFSAVESLLRLLPEEAQQKLLEENRPYVKYSRAQALCAQAASDCLSGNIGQAVTALEQAYAAFEELFGAQYDNPAAGYLAYIKRKYHNDDIQTPLLTLLRETAGNRGDAFRCINLALCYIEGNKVQPSWTQAIALFGQIEGDVLPALTWWLNSAVVGEEESALVLLMLYLTNKVSLSDIGLNEAGLKLLSGKISCLPPNFHQLFPHFEF